jgi:hypothetical protein
VLLATLGRQLPCTPPATKSMEDTLGAHTHTHARA